MEVNGAVALVTGGANGLGLAIATYLQNQGARVVVVDLDGDALANLSNKFECHRLDVTSPGDVKTVVKKITEKNVFTSKYINASTIKTGDSCCYSPLPGDEPEFILHRPT